MGRGGQAKPCARAALLGLCTTGPPFLSDATIACLPVACTKDAKICPDGSVVGRDSRNNCEFFPCPGVVLCLANVGGLCCACQRVTQCPPSPHSPVKHVSTGIGGVPRGRSKPPTGLGDPVSPNEGKSLARSSRFLAAAVKGQFNEGSLCCNEKHPVWKLVCGGLRIFSPSGHAVKCGPLGSGQVCLSDHLCHWGLCTLT